MDRTMQKGLSRRVIVLRRPDVRYFDEAIFILKKDADEESGVSPEIFMLEAEEAARRCADIPDKKANKWVTVAAWASGIAGFAMGAAAAWLIFAL